MNKKKITSVVTLQLVATILLLAFIALAFVIFMRDNRLRTVEQNGSFIEAATRETARRIGGLVEDSAKNAEVISGFYEYYFDGYEETPKISSELLQMMADRSSFDYVEFISPDGIDLTAEGLTADLSDREYFRLGMQGKSGRCVIYNSRITNETLLIFYTPFRYKGEVAGVISCILRGDTLHDALVTDYFGEHGSTYLIERNGDIIFSVNGAKSEENLPEYLIETEKLSDSDRIKFEEALRADNGIDSNSFNYQGSNGEGNAYITAIGDGEWMLVQSFPSSVTKRMTESANSAGVRLMIMLLAAFLAYVIYVIARNWFQKKQLVTEKQEILSIIDATKGLFTRFSLVDFKKNTYEYLENKKSSAPASGNYTELMEYLSERYIDDGGKVKMSQAISPEFVREHLTKDVPYLQYEYEIDMDGRRWENVSIICIKRKNGKPVNVLYAIQDVTPLKEREQEIRAALKNSYEAAEAANRAKSDFLARMSHDIRTPMNAIMGMTAVAAMHLDDKERLSDCLTKITISSRHLLALINDVLDMSKIESGKVSLNEEPFSMADMVDSIVTIIKQQVKGKNQEFKVHINEIRHEDVIGDILRLRQVFVNILGNAVKFTPEGGTIVFSIRETEPSVHGMVSFEFVCEDTGMGMDKEFMKTIFDPFSRGKNTSGIEGTGLGMPITRNIIRMMGGDISVESEVGVGSKFTVQIPLKPQEGIENAADELRDLRVLVVDDDKDSCVTTCDILGGIGMKAEYVLSGEEAIDKTVSEQESGNGYSAVILDWKMPGKDGIETAKEIRKRVGNELPIIILSAYDWTEIEGKARDAGIQAFIEKPLFRSRLVYALKSVLTDEEKIRKTAADELTEVSFEGKRVLLVEDNELNLEIARELLSYTGVAVESAENGEIAVGKVKENPDGYYDLVFMDIQMPVMNGYDASAAIRAIGTAYTKNLPIIAMTANAFSDDIFKAHEAGMNGHISKPVEVSKLTETLKSWLK